MGFLLLFTNQSQIDPGSLGEAVSLLIQWPSLPSSVSLTLEKELGEDQEEGWWASVVFLKVEDEL